MRVPAALLALAAAVAPGAAGAFSSGVSGMSGRPPGSRCSGCHSAGQTAAPTVQVTGPMRAQGGTLAVFTVESSGLVAGIGFDVAASAGSLSIIEPVVRMQLRDGDLSHTAAWPHASDRVTFTVGWLLPPDVGPATLFVAILSVDGDGSASGDAETYTSVDVDVRPPPDLAGLDLAGLDLATVQSGPDDMQRPPLIDEKRWGLECGLRPGGVPARSPPPLVAVLLAPWILVRARRRRSP